MRSLMKNWPRGYPFSLEKTLGEQQLNVLRKTYYHIVNTCIEKKPETLLVDKLPLNIIKVPLIKRVFPNAKFILAMRHPLDACFSCFSHNFKLNDAMCNFLTLQDTALFYDHVFSFWQLCRDKLSLNVHIIRLEDLVADFKGEVEKTLDFIGVGWDQKVLDYHRHAIVRNYIRTPSYSQVTEKINAKGINRYQQYRQMDAFKDRLSLHAHNFGYSV